MNLERFHAQKYFSATASTANNGKVRSVSHGEELQPFLTYDNGNLLTQNVHHGEAVVESETDKETANAE